MNLQIQNIPKELKAMPQWVVRQGKIPLNPRTGKGAKAGQPDTWSSFETALSALQKGYDGIGFQFNNNGIVGIDLDHVIDKNTGAILPEAQQVVDLLDSYTEISPSGTGLHIYVYGNIPTKGRKNTTRNIEMYKAVRYFTVTGNVYGTVKPIEHRKKETIQLYSELFPEPESKPTAPRHTPTITTDKNYLAIGLEKDSKFKDIWDGKRRTGDESSDDMSLMNKLAYWCNCDERLMIDAFRSSPYAAGKDPAHLKKADRKDYLTRTAAEAIRKCNRTALDDDENFQKEKERLDRDSRAGDKDEKSPYSKLFEGTSFFIRKNHFYRKYRKGDAELEQYLANFIIIAEAETVRDNGIDCDRVFRLRAVCEGKELPSADIPAKDYSSMNFIPQVWGLALRPSVGQNTLAYIKDSIGAQAKNVRQEYIYTHTGWRKIKGKWAFLHSGGAIGAEGVRVELDGRLSRYELSELSSQEDPKKAVQTSLDMFKVAPIETMIPLMGFAFLSPLNEFLRQSGIEPSFILYLLGSTGAMKSTLAALVLSFFGRFDNKCLPESFKDTANSLEKQGFLLKDVLTVVDDYHPTGSIQEARKMQATAQAVARMYGDRTGRGRMNADATLRQSYIPRGNAIITGEDLPDIGQSGIARNIIINMEKDSVDKSILTALQNNYELLSGCMSEYIKWLIPQADSLPKRLKEQFQALRNAAIAENRHGRTTETTAQLQIGITFYFQFLADYGVLSKDDVDQKTQQSWKILLDIADKQSKQLEQEKPTTLFLNAFHEMLETKEIRVMEIKDVPPSGNHYMSNFVGYVDEDYYYLHADSVFKSVVQFYKAQDKNFPVKKQTLIKQLVTEKLVEPDLEKNRNVKQKKINGKNKSLLWLVHQKQIS